ncbi:hypothetical protein EVAR_15785_1 [Eumeta japonica]|uniref:Uncharacterized protein n=1 Tax=Eumeta variegata TaxID=151549 RepID=A0A4C1TZK7_EUMVA|nr:hypothetical protein EVAR_15785_1 [Eumeta japonica]
MRGVTSVYNFHRVVAFQRFHQSPCRDSVQLTEFRVLKVFELETKEKRTYRGKNTITKNFPFDSSASGGVGREIFPILDHFKEKAYVKLKESTGPRLSGGDSGAGEAWELLINACGIQLLSL